MDDAFGGGLVQKLSGVVTELLGSIELPCGYAFSEVPNGGPEPGFDSSVTISTNHVLSQSLFCSLGVWHLENLLHYWIIS